MCVALTYSRMYVRGMAEIQVGAARNERKRPSENTEEHVPNAKITCSPVVAICVPVCRGFHGSRKGEREDMQDHHVIIDKFIKQTTPQICAERCAFYAVYDGHNGPKASKHCADKLHLAISDRLPKGPNMETIEKCVKRVFVESYKKIDEEFLTLAAKQKPVWKDGSTSSTILILNNSLFVANLGDSRAILCRHKVEENRDIALTLTKDHSPQDFEERMRIQKTGATVIDGRVQGMLEVSRSIGDGQFKKYGVSCVPDVKKCVLTPNDKYLVIACDGLWKSFSNQQVIEFITQQLQNPRDQYAMFSAMQDSGRTREGVIWMDICSELAAEAVRRGSADNVTVLIVLLK